MLIESATRLATVRRLQPTFGQSVSLWDCGHKKQWSHQNINQVHAHAQNQPNFQMRNQSKSDNGHDLNIQLIWPTWCQFKSHIEIRSDSFIGVGKIW